MNLKRIISVYEIIKKRLPKKYPKPSLIFYEDYKCMLTSTGLKYNKNEEIYAVFDPNNKSINICIETIKILSNLNITKILLHELYHAYVDHNNISTKTDEEILADKFAARWIKKINIDIDINRFMGWTDREIQYLKENYPWKPKSEIINEIGRDWASIKSKASKLKIKRINQSKFWCDHYFFSPPFNEKKMWVAGFIAADGCIRSNSYNIKIDISYKDIEVLHKIKKIIKFTGNILKYERNGKKYAVLSFSSKQMVDDLKRYYNIFSKKSITFCPNEKVIESIFFNHFLRGFSDGDGSFYIYSKKESHHLRYKLIGGKIFLIKILKWLKKNGIAPVKIRRSKKIYEITFGGNTKVKKIASLLYKDANSDIYMTRKKEVINSNLITKTEQNKFVSIVKINPITGEREFFESIKNAVKIGFTYSGIYDVCNGRAKTHRGFRWEYL